jgi:hypothetical protein
MASAPLIARMIIVPAILFATGISAAAQAPRTRQTGGSGAAATKSRFTVGIDGESGGQATYQVFGTSVSVSEVLGHFLLYRGPTDKSLTFNGIYILRGDGIAQLQKSTDDVVAMQALEFIENRKALLDASDACHTASDALYYQQSNPRLTEEEKRRYQTSIDAKNKECQYIDKKLLSGLKSLGDSDKEFRKLGIIGSVDDDKDD